MNILEYDVRFLTPAFLGDAEQSGRWRTPPFKALLRQWWRVVYAADHRFDVDVEAMRREEGLLFGNAWLTHEEESKEVADHTKSLVRLRLSQWTEGRENSKSWGFKDLDPPSGQRNAKPVKVRHPEVPRPIGPLLYLGYGPLETKRTGQNDWATVLKRRAAIQVGETARLTLAIPSWHPKADLRDCLGNNVGRIETALALMNLYATVGGRCRNGWGSFVLKRADNEKASAGEFLLPKRAWRQALRLDWPHAVGVHDDGRPLIWRTKDSYSNWLDVMRALAIIRIGVRTQFQFPQRYWLSYPVTHPVQREWGKNMRLPNSLRFKVRLAPESPEKLIGVIFHMPCLPPNGFKPDDATVEKTWQAVHALLDELANDSGARSYGWIEDFARRDQLKNLLSTVSLVRVKE
jgi:CRISPR-associated protein Cmr1